MAVNVYTRNGGIYKRREGKTNFGLHAFVYHFGGDACLLCRLGLQAGAWMCGHKHVSLPLI